MVCIDLEDKLWISIGHCVSNQVLQVFIVCSIVALNRLAAVSKKVQQEWRNIKLATASRWWANTKLQKVNLLHSIHCIVGFTRCLPIHFSYILYSHIKQKMTQLNKNKQDLVIHYINNQRFCWGVICGPFYCLADSNPKPVWRLLRHFLSWLGFSGPVSVRCHGSQGDRADVIRMGVPWLPWRQSDSAVWMLEHFRYTKTEHTPYKNILPAWLQNGEHNNNNKLSSAAKRCRLNQRAPEADGSQHAGVYTLIFHITRQHLAPHLSLLFFFLGTLAYTQQKGSVFRACQCGKEVQVNSTVSFPNNWRIQSDDKWAHATHRHTHTQAHMPLVW